MPCLIYDINQFIQSVYASKYCSHSGLLHVYAHTDKSIFSDANGKNLTVLAEFHTALNLNGLPTLTVDGSGNVISIAVPELSICIIFHWSATTTE